MKRLFAFLALLFGFVPAAMLQAQYGSDADYQRGMELAKQQQWAEAKQTFESGRKKAPRDKRFPIELAGIAFKQHSYREARHYLRAALNLDAKDHYVLQFLGTLYFLQGNIDAAVFQWNKIGRPFVEAIKTSGKPEVRPALLDRAFAVSFGGVLELEKLQETKAKIESLQIFPRYSFRLVPANEENFDLVFTGIERNGFGSTRADMALSFLRGLPYETVYPEYYNWNHSAINLLSLARWDSRRRRIWASISGPLQNDPKYRFHISVQARDEVWKVDGLSDHDFKFQTQEGGFELDSILTARWKIASSVSLSNRNFQDLSLFQEGNTIEYSGTATHQLVFPELSLTSTSFLTIDAGRFVNHSGRYARLEAGNSWSSGWWKAGICAGKTFGSLPFDRFFILGVDRDNDLLLRAHSNLTGKKGDLPMARTYILINSEADKIVFRHPLFRGTVGPFVDFANISDPVTPTPARNWFLDSGIQMKLHLLNSITANFVYGRDLRTGSDTFYISITR